MSNADLHERTLLPIAPLEALYITGRRKVLYAPSKAFREAMAAARRDVGAGVKRVQTRLKSTAPTAMRNSTFSRTRCGVQISRHGSSSGLSESSRKARRLALRVTGAKFGFRMNTCTPQGREIFARRASSDRLQLARRIGLNTRRKLSMVLFCAIS
jgi:ribosomal protein L34